MRKNEALVSPERLRELLEIDKDWRLRWRVSGHSRFVGKEAGSSLASGYERVSVDNISFKYHRVVYAIFYGEWPRELLDHKDGNKKNNNIDNLRGANNRQNLKNRGAFKNNTSGAKGVAWAEKPKSWKARIVVDGKYHHLGYHKDRDFAIFVRQCAEEKYFAEYRRSAE